MNIFLFNNLICVRQSLEQTRFQIFRMLHNPRDNRRVLCNFVDGESMAVIYTANVYYCLLYHSYRESIY